MSGFVYCWTDKKTNKLYVGSHKGSEDDGYVCSSKLVLEHMAERPDDFSRQIIAHGSFDDCIKLETAILHSADAKHNPDFYNMHNGDGKFYHTEWTKEAIEKLRKTKTGKKRPPFSNEWKQKMSISHSGDKHQGANNWMFGKTQSEESNQSRREKCSGANNYWYGRTRTRIECPYCQRSIDTGNAKRWHFDNCKSKSK